MSTNRQRATEGSDVGQVSVVARVWTALRTAPRRVLISFIRAYQIVLSPRLGSRCRFHPSCSAYGVAALGTHGALKGTVLTVGRVGRCHPWNRGGVNPIPERGSWRSPVNPDGTSRAPQVETAPPLSAVTEVRPTEFGVGT